MLKKEQIWREILNDCFENQRFSFTQQELAKRLNVSLSTVNNALSTPRKARAIHVFGRGFKITDKEKFLILWATVRNLEKDTIYQTYINVATPVILEGQMPPEIIFGGYSGFVRKFNEAPADYSAVYIYADLKILEEIKKRFPPTNKNDFNLTILKADGHLKKFGSIVPSVQMFTDLWNAPQWYAKDFLQSLKLKLKIE